MSALRSMEVRHLPNGLTLIMVPRAADKVVTVDLWVKVGSADEPPEVSGVSHFLEHMVFKGAAGRGVGEIDQAVEGVGGYMNAATSHDYTHFYITVPGSEISSAVDALSDMALRATLDSDELNKEREVVLEEFNRKQDDPQGLLWEQVYERSFRSGPYKQPVLGTPETLRGLDREKMLDFYRRHYAPGNMTLVVAGGFDVDTVQALADKAFSGSDHVLNPAQPEAPPCVYAVDKREVYERELNETYGVLAFPAPAMLGVENRDEILALDVLQFILGAGRSSILSQEIKEKKRLATSIYAGYSSARFPDLFYVSYTCEEKNRRALEEAVIEEIEKVRDNLPSSDKLNRAKKLLINAHAFSMETTSGLSSSIGYYYTVCGSLDFERHYAEGVRKVDGEQVREVARRILDFDKLNRFAVRPMAKE